MQRNRQRLRISFFTSGCAWLILACLLQQLRALELIFPQFCAHISWLSFGRVDAAAEACFLYGWGSCIAFSCGLKLCSPSLIIPFETILVFFWNLSFVIGIGLILGGQVVLASLLPTGINFFLLILSLFLCVPVVITCLQNKIPVSSNAPSLPSPLYSRWLLGSFFLLPVLFFTAATFLKEGILRGAARLPVEAWFHECFLWLWLGGSALAFAYYFLTEVLHASLVEKRLASIGFWIFFVIGSWASLRVVAGGALPAWMSAAGISSNLLLWVPVVVLWCNFCRTLKQYSFTVETSPALRFITFGAYALVLCSIQGIVLYSKSGAPIFQFTDFAYSQAILTRYGFITSIFCGALYYFVPRILSCNWPQPQAIYWHFHLYWLGLALVVISLAIGGTVQGILLNNPVLPFSASYIVAFPWRCLAGFGWSLLLVSKLIFAFHFGQLIYSAKKIRRGIIATKNV